MAPKETSSYRFGIFELDLRSGELFKNGTNLKIQEQSFQVLALLLARAGEPVTRDELRNQLWPADTFVDFEHSINAAIKRLREALSDDAENPIFIETLPRRGYRFIAPVSYRDVDPAKTWKAPRLPRKIVYGFVCPGVFGVIAIGAWFYFADNVESKLPSGIVVPLTSLPDRAEDASISPDGNQLAFRRESDSPGVSGVYVKQIGREHLLQLTKGTNDSSPAWSPDGRSIAFSRYENGLHEIYMVSAIGGAEYKLHSGEPAHPPLNWSRDAKFIAFTAKDPSKNTYSINLLSIDNLQTRKLTEPGSEQQDWGPAFSPNGQDLAFIRTNGALTIADIFIVPLTGGVARRLTFDNTDILSPPAWTPDGRSIVFSSPRRSIPTLWRIPISGGAAVQVPNVGVVTQHPSVSLRGHRLAYDQTTGSSSIWSVALPELSRSGSHVQITASGGRNWAPQISPDGQRIVFLSDRTGALELWACKRDGSELIRLTNLGKLTSTGPPRWSPDSQSIAFDSSLGEHNAIFVMKAEAGVPRALMQDTSDNVNASWSRDGKWIYFTSNRDGHWQIWKMPSEGGPPLQLTKQGGFVGLESADGKFVYYAQTPSSTDIWRVPSAGGEEHPISPRIHIQQWRDWALTDDGIFFCPERSARNSAVRFLHFASATIKEITSLEKPSNWISASADGRFLLYNQSDRWEANIMLLENFR